MAARAAWGVPGDDGPVCVVTPPKPLVSDPGAGQRSVEAGR